MFKRFLLLLLPLLALGACSKKLSQKDLMKVTLGLSKNEIINHIGEPNVLRGSILNKHGQVIEVYEYDVKRGINGKLLSIGICYGICTLGIGFIAMPAFIDEKIANYWLYFYDNKLVQWGQAGDWKKEADVIYEMRFS